MFNIKQALTYFLDDKDWKIKFAIGFFVSLMLNIGNFAPKEARNNPISIAITVIFSIIIFAYLIICTNMRIHKKGNLILPDWEDVLKRFTVGIGYWAILFIYGIFLVIPVVNILIPFLMFAAIASFSINLDFKSAFEFNKIWFIANKNFVKILLLFLITIIISLMFGIIIALMFGGIIIALMIFKPILCIACSFVSFYMILIYADLTAQFVRKIFKMEDLNVEKV